MSIATTDSVDMRPLTSATHLVRRALWKEYRMLRGFWLAILALGVAMQWLLSTTLMTQNSQSYMVLLTAWGAAALYAVGASITVFSAESEERTHGFLLNLPNRWLPVFASKVVLTLLTAFGLGLVLCTTNYLFSGALWQSTTEFKNAFALAGVAIFEATAWSLLFSLLMKQPLLAAIAGMVCTSFGMQLAILANYGYTYSTNSYINAAPLRLLLAGMVFLLDLWLGYRWFQTSNRGLFSSRQKTVAQEAGKLRKRKPDDRRRTFSRLLWQTWRESRTTMLAAFFLAPLLMLSVTLPIELLRAAPSNWRADILTPVLTLLFLPALFGALVFRADQKKEFRQNLLTHAVSPHKIWLARHMFWGTGILLMIVASSVVIWGVTINKTDAQLIDILRRNYGTYIFGGRNFDDPLSNPWQLAAHLEHVGNMAVQATYLCWTSILAAYACGQFFSLHIRREILAGLLAIIFSMVLAAWAAVVLLWQLSAWLFIFPIGLAALLATWLRMSAWLHAKSQLRSWILPAVVISAPLVLIALFLPSVRIEQVQGLPGKDDFANDLQKFEADKANNLATGRAYEQLYQRLRSTLDSSDLDENLSELQRQLKIYSTKDRPERQVLVMEFIELTKRTNCELPGYLVRQNTLHDLGHLLLADAKRLEEEDNLDAALDRYLALYRFMSHQFRNQPILEISPSLEYVYYSRDSVYRTIDKSLLNWAQLPSQTSRLLRKAALRLQQCPEIISAPQELIFAERERVRNIIVGDQSPNIAENNVRHSDHLVLLANQFSWEQQRALAALEIYTKQILENVWTAVGNSGLSAQKRRLLIGNMSESLLLSPMSATYRGHRYGYQQAVEAIYRASSSFLVSKELASRFRHTKILRNIIDFKIRRQGLVLQMALLAYRHDHQQYPETLDELTPDYLTALPIDPLTDKPLEYRPQGFDLPLVIHRTTRSTDIPAHSPIMWSQNIENLQPVEDTLVLEKNAPEDHTYHWVSVYTRASYPYPREFIDFKIEESLQAVRFQSTENIRNCWSLPYAIFVLPPLDTGEAEKSATTKSDSTPKRTQSQQN